MGYNEAGDHQRGKPLRSVHLCAILSLSKEWKEQSGRDAKQTRHHELGEVLTPTVPLLYAANPPGGNRSADCSGSDHCNQSPDCLGTAQAPSARGKFSTPAPE